MKRQLVLGAFLATGCLTGVAHATLITDGSFETPVVPSGSYQSFTSGQSIDGAWTVVGSSGDQQVTIISSSYTENDGTLQFQAEDGTQFIDLTGPSNQGDNGIEQVVATAAGVNYALTFWVGSEDSTQPYYTTPGSVELEINGVDVGTYTNDNSTSDNMNWEEFTYSFTATGATTIEFDNATPLSGNMAGLDNVSLVDPPAIPEPGSLALFGSALVGIGAMRRRQRKTA